MSSTGELRENIRSFCDDILRQGATLARDKRYLGGRAEVDSVLDGEIMPAIEEHVANQINAVLNDLEESQATYLTHPEGLPIKAIPVPSIYRQRQKFKGLVKERDDEQI